MMKTCSWLLAAALLALSAHGAMAQAPPVPEPPEGLPSGPPNAVRHPLYLGTNEPPGGPLASPPEPGRSRGWVLAPPDGVSVELEDPVEGRESTHLIENLIRVRLARQLGLDEAQREALTQRIVESREQMRRSRQGRRELADALRASLQSGADADVIQDYLEQLRRHDREMAEQRQQEFDVMAEGLTAAQRARLYVFLEDFDGQLRRTAMEARERRRPMQPGETEMPLRPEMRRRRPGETEQGGPPPRE